VCITHLPQIAAYAAAHFRVEKEERDGRVHTVVRRLSASERKEEIARMLGGKVTPKARAHAEELLRGAREARG
jgi:DNA repair protein RecN (Recombination protein N)